MRTALFPSGDGMLNFSAFYPKNSKICYSCLVSDISFEDVEEVLHISSAAFGRFGDKIFVITTSTASYNDFSNILKG
jgi:hypothetical protein